MKLTNLNSLRPVKIRWNPTDEDSTWNLYLAYLDAYTFVELCEVISTGKISYARLIGKRKGREVSLKIDNKEEILDWIKAMLYVTPVDRVDYSIEARQTLVNDFKDHLED